VFLPVEEQKICREQIMARQGFRGFRPTLVSLAVASCFVSSSALANPTGAQVVNGQVSILQNGNLLQITNSPNSIINWQSFSIGANEITRFVQQSQSSAVLNRVTGSAGAIDPSVILGALQSNGRVFLVNPSGILFGAGAQVDVAGLVATSLNLSNSDFLSGKLKFTDGANAGSVVNQGNITTGAGGEVYLVGNAVSNNGIITSPNGDVVLAAGNSVELVNPGTPNLRVEVVAADNQATNLGQIVAESGRIGIYAGLVSNSGTVRADSAVAEGGRILLKATKNVTLESTSILDASGNGGGTIEVLADKKNGGTVNIDGKLDASAPVSGNGGFIETSAERVKVADSAVIRTAASSGKSGMWLVDPVNWTIATYGGDISGAAVSSALYGGDVTYTADNDIFVQDNISWSSGYSLTLTAGNNVNVSNASIIGNSGSGNVNVTAAGGDIVLSSATIDTGGNVSFAAGRDIKLDGSRAWAGFNSFSGDRSVNFSAGRNIDLINSSSVEATAGIGNATVNMAAAGNVSIQGNSSVYASVDGGEGGAAAVTVSAGGAISLSDSFVSAEGGEACCGGSGGGATVNMTAGTALSVSNSSVYAEGGEGSTGGNAVINLIGGTGLSIDGGEGITAEAGYGFDGNGGAAGILLGSGGSLVLNNAFAGAAGGEAGTSLNGNGGDATVLLAAAGPVSVSNSGIFSVAGSGAGSGSGGNAGTLMTGSSIAIDSSFVIAEGGEGSTGGSALVGMLANGGGISISASAQPLGPFTILESSPSSMVVAAGGPGDTAGGSAVVELTSATGVSVDNGQVMALGGPGSAMGGAAILLNFPLLATGGYSVNGIDGAITDSDGIYGFFVNENPAILNQNLLVTYATTLPPAVQQEVNQVVASTNQQTTLTDTGQSDTGETGTEDDKKKQQLPICGK
jgi:filamentous hemagglutinin family protein